MRKIFLAVILVTFSVCANAVVVDYTTVVDGTFVSVSLGGTTVTGSSNVTSGLFPGTPFRGLGIEGVASPSNGDLSLDFSEVMSIDFGTSVGAVTLSIVDIAPVGNILFEFEAFDGLTSLGSFGLAAATMAPESYDLFAGTGLSHLTSLSFSVLTPSSPVPPGVPFGLQLQGLSYSVVPIPATLWLFGTALIGLVGFSKRRNLA